MKKILLSLLVLPVFFWTWFTYEVQQWDNTLLTKIYDQIDNKLVTHPQSLVLIDENMPQLQVKYWTSEKNTYFLTKIWDYIKERLYVWVDADSFVCLQEKVQNQDTVTISYNLMTEEWINISLSKWEYTLQDTTPLLFNPWSWSIIEGIEREVLWMKMSQRKGVRISHREAYWSEDTGLFVTLPRQAVENISETSLKIDQRVHMNIVINWVASKRQWFIKEIWTESVIIDFNRPLAGHWIIWLIQIDNLFKNCQ